MAAEIKREVKLEIVHVLFLDIVGYSKALTDEQQELIDRLNQVVRGSEEFQKAAAADRLIKIPTGDGMALIFYNSPEQPVNCAVEISRALKNFSSLPVRMGEDVRLFELIRVHAEEDTGKSFHPERYGDRQVSRVDFNRAGVPLLELVTLPVFRDPAECAAFLTALRRLVRWLGISEGDR